MAVRILSDLSIGFDVSGTSLIQPLDPAGGFKLKFSGGFCADRTRESGTMGGIPRPSRTSQRFTFTLIEV